MPGKRSTCGIHRVSGAFQNILADHRIARLVRAVQGKMSLPSVCAIMLVDGREKMALRAANSFMEQTYGKAWLLMFDTGKTKLKFFHLHPIIHAEAERLPSDCIGTLRNRAVEFADRADIIVHWDSDDFSHPERIAEQVEALQGYRVTGYHSMLFWDETKRQCFRYKGAPNFLIGTSLCYWRETWKATPFPELNAGEDTAWQKGLRKHAVSSIDKEPRMIASIHGGNTTCKVVYDLDRKTGAMKPHRPEWTRAAEWDAHCAEVMRL